MLWADEMVIASKERVRKRKMVRRDRVLIVDDAINFEFGRQAVIDWLSGETESRSNNMVEEERIGSWDLTRVRG